MAKLTGWDDTIVALATPPGIAAIGIIRLSGPIAIQIANELFPSKNLSTQSSHTLHVGFLKEGDIILDEVVISLFKSPTSYTGEDVIEISAHGSPYVHQQIISACISHGARLAKPGEFTQRAFLNGKLDLIQAESVADLIDAATATAARAAARSLSGAFSSEIRTLASALIDLRMYIEATLDFPEEDIEFV